MKFKRNLKHVLIVTLILMFFNLPTVLLAQETPLCDDEYTVQAGDWLSKIAEKYYGDPLAYDQLVTAGNAIPDDIYTDIENPDLIEPGWVICIVSASGQPLPENMAPEAPAGLSPSDLANATYQSQYTASGTATLQDGNYSEAAAPGSASQIRVSITPNLAYGSLNGQQIAAVILVTASGGSGTFYDLHVMIAPDGSASNPVTTFLGDRIEIKAIQVENDQIVVDMIEAGPDDPFCCPTQHVIKTFAWQGEQLVEVSSEVIGAEPTPAPDTDSGTGSVVDQMEHTPDMNLIDKAWAWERRDPNGNQIEEIIVANPENYLLTFAADGTFMAQMDCRNTAGRYASSSPRGDAPQYGLFMEAGPSTMIFCGEESLDTQMSQMFGPAQVYEYLEDGAVVKFIWVAGGPIDYFRYRDDIAPLTSQ